VTEAVAAAAPDLAAGWTPALAVGAQTTRVARPINPARRAEVRLLL
jgi:hypothetical protein